MLQSDWPICFKSIDLHQCVRQWSRAERIILFDVDIVVKRKKQKKIDSGLQTHKAVPLSPQQFDYCDDKYCCG